MHLVRHVKIHQMLAERPEFLALAGSLRRKSRGGAGAIELDTDYEFNMEDGFITLLKSNRLGITQINLSLALRPYLILKIVENYHTLPFDMKEAFNLNSSSFIVSS